MGGGGSRGSSCPSSGSRPDGRTEKTQERARIRTTSVTLGQLPPEHRNVHDRDVLDLAQAEQIVVGRHNLVRSAADCTLQELVIAWVAAATDGWRRLDEEPLALEEDHQGPRLDEAQAELL
jgi:hypothetical protein